MRLEKRESHPILSICPWNPAKWSEHEAVLEAVTELEERLASLGPRTDEGAAGCTDRARLCSARDRTVGPNARRWRPKRCSMAQLLGDAHAESMALGTLAFVQYIRSDLKSALANCMQALRLATGNAMADARIRVVLGDGPVDARGLR